MIARIRTMFNDKGASAVEYGLIVGLVAIAIIVGAGLLGTALNDQFTNVSNEVVTAP